ncbi:hypothetical protein [Brachybacterium sp. YJGR34]|uniref:hypothetical protein n=1 Tax=Brachybacterium sp. YJGR34 TaxID=2059911 RepID=UPI000E0BA94A|nr:hypothetical protein [Brachybacterium sp. YJGR34]
MSAGGPGILRLGFLADGAFKLLVAAAHLLLLPTLVDLLGAPAGMIALTAAMVALSAIAEIVFALRSGEGTHTKYLIAYDSGWVLATVLALMLGSGPGGWVWLAFQAAASPVLALAFLRGREQLVTSSTSL